MIMTLERAVEVLTKALKDDKELREGYKDNIAMSFQDEYIRSRRNNVGTTIDIHKVSNKAADNFLDLFIKD